MFQSHWKEIGTCPVDPLTRGRHRFTLKIISLFAKKRDHEQQCYPNPDPKLSGRSMRWSSLLSPNQPLTPHSDWWFGARIQIQETPNIRVWAYSWCYFKFPISSGMEIGSGQVSTVFPIWGHKAEWPLPCSIQRLNTFLCILFISLFDVIEVRFSEELTKLILRPKISLNELTNNLVFCLVR